MNLTDLDRSEFIDFTEFLTASLSYDSSVERKMISYAFNKFDANDDGCIDSEDIKVLLEDVKVPREEMY